MRHLNLATLMPLLLVACGKFAPPEEPVRAVRTQVVQAGVSAQRVEYAAEVKPRTESRLGFRVAGKLEQRWVNVGDQVKAGQPLARLDGRDLKLGQDQARASVNAATAQLELSEAEFKRYKELKDQGFISGLELERREAALKAARAQAEQAKAQNSLQTNQAGYAVLAADVSGVVTAVDAEPGAVLAAGTAVVRLALDGPRDVVFSVPEDRAGALRSLMGRPGALKFRVWGNDASLKPATVREVAASADPATRTFQVKTDIGPSLLKLGQSATIVLEAPGAPGVVKLPIAAVFEQAGQAHVWVLDTGARTVRAQPVVVSGADGNWVVVASGLTPGQTVVTAGAHALTPGQKVRQYAEPAGQAPSAPVVMPASAAAVATQR
jgi:RND family efflux transporter MFP subunit